MLSWQVTYWDRLGWKDTFGDPAFTARQRDYAAWGRSNVFTPEVVVNGRIDLVGNDPRELAASVAGQDRGTTGPTITLDADKVVISGPALGTSRAADVLLVRYDPKIVEVPIRHGENGGRTLPHLDVVRELHMLGTWSPGTVHCFALPKASRSNLNDAVLIQAGRGGIILGAARG